MAYKYMCRYTTRYMRVYKHKHTTPYIFITAKRYAFLTMTDGVWNGSIELFFAVEKTMCAVR